MTLADVLGQLYRVSLRMEFCPQTGSNEQAGSTLLVKYVV